MDLHLHRVHFLVLVIIIIIINTACWYVDGDNLTKASRALHILLLQLSPPSPSLIAPIKSRTETFCFRLTHVHAPGKLAVKMERERDANVRGPGVTERCLERPYL